MIEKREGDKYIVSINASDPRTRQRFTLAHELGHYIYTRTKWEMVSTMTACIEARMPADTTTRIGAKQETQANQFAANLLMPWSGILHLQDAGVNNYEDLAEALEVSKQAMRIRLGIED